MAQRKRPNAVLPARALPTPRGATEGERVEAGVSLVGPGDTDTLDYILSHIRSVPDFPSPGILFRDITPLLASPRCFHIVLDAIAHRFVGENISAVVGVESRGFIFGGALAARLNASFVPVRKAGKLPSSTDRVSYSLEYGEAELEMHRDALVEDSEVLIVDDLLATGGTAAAAAELVERQGANVHAFAFVIELAGLEGRARLEGYPVISVVRYA
ncbi:MAG TPA: adenine phosphoribosyltransferase [Polyangiaceae bacterium]|nr:adenine phosphoribosyltransferase [Polyangiaceae bacterium]